MLTPSVAGGTRQSPVRSKGKRRYTHCTTFSLRPLLVSLVPIESPCCGRNPDDADQEQDRVFKERFGRVPFPAGLDLQYITEQAETTEWHRKDKPAMGMTPFTFHLFHIPQTMIVRPSYSRVSSNSFVSGSAPQLRSKRTRWHSPARQREA